MNPPTHAPANLAAPAAGATGASPLPVRFVTAAALFDGHDASINIVRRLLVREGAEVIHLGHNRSALEVVRAALQEDAQGIALSSYQGGHMEYFKYVLDLLRERGAGHVKVYGGGGGVIVAREIAELEKYGVTRIYSPQDGRRLGMVGIAQEMIATCRYDTLALPAPKGKDAAAVRDATIARAITAVERSAQAGGTVGTRQKTMPVLGITGTGGAGKSSLTDELVRRIRFAAPEMKLALVLIDPSKRVTGGALLADRIRLNGIESSHVYVRSLATRGSQSEVSAALSGTLAVLESQGFDLCLVETSGIGQGDSAIVDFTDASLYVMTPEFGAPSQLEKIDMLDLADLVVINKADRRGAEDALRDVRRQLRRTRALAPGLRPETVTDESMPAYATVASRFNDPGVNRLFGALADLLRAKFGLFREPPKLPPAPSAKAHLLPPDRVGYLGEIVRKVRGYRRTTEEQAERLSRIQALEKARAALAAGGGGDRDTAAAATLLARKVDAEKAAAARDAQELLAGEKGELAKYAGDDYRYEVRGKQHAVKLHTTSLSGSKIPKVALPRLSDDGDLYRYFRLENVPGRFPYTAGIYPFKRVDEEPRRQFAGEGGPARTNKRFHYLSRHDAAKRLSVAFDSVTLYGEDPEERPDIYGKIGEGGVSICTVEDMQVLMQGFDLCDANTSVSMTINGPAPIVLAFFLNAAIEQQCDAQAKRLGRAVSEEERKKLAGGVLKVVRGTVQADILKEDQAQNTCIYSTDFSLKLMGDVQEFFTKNDVRNFYSVSISGYHIAEAGANPISQLAFTLANGFTFVEYYLARGLPIDAFAHNLSFFFSNGLDPEYSVMGRVARRIWSVALRDLYGASERGQKFKYHIQTSGRSLHAMEIDFNDIRTTLQALTAIYDQCNSLHTNAYDEAITTPTEESVRRAMAIQMILQREFGVTKNENPAQGAYLTQELTDLVEEAVLREFERLHERGGVLGAMETHYQRGRIQEESLLYELKKDSGELPIVGVNCFERPKDGEAATAAAATPPAEIPLARASNAEKDDQIARLRDFQRRHAAQAPAALQRLQEVALAGGNVFAELMETVRVASLGQISGALFSVGGRYRRSL
ncbi:MAG: cobalamin-dependent protein [Planctomycetes bacterium]|nr:cobalamin-dependent protein [Planctomycetota bacterium]